MTSPTSLIVPKTFHMVLAGGNGFLGRAICENMVNAIQSNSGSIFSNRNVQLTIISRRQPTFKLPDFGYNISDSSSVSASSITLKTCNINVGLCQENSDQKSKLQSVLASADLVVNLVGIMYPDPPIHSFSNIHSQWPKLLGQLSANYGFSIIHISAIGARTESKIPYQSSKGLGETLLRSAQPKSIILRPSLIFGPGDQFFNRFLQLLNFMPFLPYFGDGSSKFQPVHVQDVANLIIKMAESMESFSGKTFELGGPKVYTYKQLMELTIKKSGKVRFTLSLPRFIGLLQGFIMEKLPINIMTITRDQVKMLDQDNIVSERRGGHGGLFKDENGNEISTFRDAGITKLVSIEEYFLMIQSK